MIMNRNDLMPKLEELKLATGKSNFAITSKFMYKDGVIYASSLSMSAYAFIAPEMDNDISPFMIDAKTFMDVIKKCPSNMINMDVIDFSLQISSEKFTTHLNVETDYDSFPTIEDAWKTNEFFPMTSDFLRGLSACSRIAKSAKDYENVLKSIHLVDERIEASDGFRAVCYYVNTNTKDTLVSGQSILSILKCKLASYTYTETDMYFKTDNDVFFVFPKNKNDEYGDRVYKITHDVDTADAIPITNAGDLIAALSRVSIMADTFSTTKNKKITFRFSTDQVKVLGESDLGNANETVKIAYQGSALQFATCPDYVIEALEDTTQMVLSERLMFLFTPAYKCALVIQ